MFIRDYLPRVKKCKRSETPPEWMDSNNKAWYIKQEKRAAKYMVENNSDYKDI